MNNRPGLPVYIAVDATRVAQKDKPRLQPTTRSINRQMKMQRKNTDLFKNNFNSCDDKFEINNPMKSMCGANGTQSTIIYTAANVTDAEMTLADRNEGLPRPS